MSNISNIKLRHILNSNADMAVEAEIELQDGTRERGSSPAAILPGKREKRTTDKQNMQRLNIIEDEIKECVLGNTFDQWKLDRYLDTLIEREGTDICLALSIAFAKAMASSEKINLAEYILRQLQVNSRMKMPYILIPVFSGGVHAKNSKNSKDSFQQIMVCIKETVLEQVYLTAKKIYLATENELEKRKIIYCIANSGGYMTEKLSTLEKLNLLREIIVEVGCDKSTAIAVDIAAEHLLREGQYCLDGELISSERLFELLYQYVNEFHMCYIEDPFVAEDVMKWERLRNLCGESVHIIGDDLFATQEKYIDPKYANGIVIKMNQVGTLSNSILAIQKARKKGLAVCVSHRSFETEDTTMCDLAVASAAEYIKIGGMRRGERLIKYNQLLRLAEILEN